VPTQRPEYESRRCRVRQSPRWSLPSLDRPVRRGAQAIIRVAKRLGFVVVSRESFLQSLEHGTDMLEEDAGGHRGHGDDSRLRRPARRSRQDGGSTRSRSTRARPVALTCRSDANSRSPITGALDHPAHQLKRPMLTEPYVLRRRSLRAQNRTTLHGIYCESLCRPVPFERA
jgi:hypothetical protein